MKKKKLSAKPKHSASRTVAKKKTREVWSIKRIWLPLGLAVIALAALSTTTYTQEFKTNVLGDTNEQENEQQKQQLEQQQEAQKQAAEQQQEAQKGSVQVNVQQKEMEIQNANGQTIKAKVEDNGSRKVESSFGGVQFKFEDHAGEMKLNAVDSEGNHVATAEAERKILEKEFADEELKIASKEGEIELEHNGQRVRTNFPLSIDPVTHQLIVTTPAGTKAVTVLPDQAVNNMLRNGLLTSVASGSAESSGSASFALTLHNDQSVYEIHGQKQARFLGVFPVTLDRTVLVSTENGERIAQQESFLTTLLGFLSF